ncbi:MAG: ATP-binding protein [bacterium]|jgi:signal transduction histidine kinase|nr:ATP-binding protein [bacterium]
MKTPFCWEPGQEEQQAATAAYYPSQSSHYLFPCSPLRQNHDASRSPGPDPSVFSSFLEQTKTIYYVAADRSGRILAFNPAFCQLVDRKAATLAGQSLWPLLTESNQQQIQHMLAKGSLETFSKRKVHLVKDHVYAITLECVLVFSENQFVLLGEEPVQDNLQSQEEIVHLNNELAVLTRENIKQRRITQQALEDLKEAQLQLIQKEKMAALGQMTAGIAHEINNPITFIQTNHELMQAEFHDLLSFINLIGDALPELRNAIPGLYSRLIQKANAIRLPHLAEALPRQMQTNLQGLTRITEIVLLLRKYIRLDEADGKECLLSEDLNATLQFLEPLCQKSQVRIVTDYQIHTPVFCYPAALNQAVSNLLTNAIQASPPGATVHLRTRLDQDHVVIEVIDQGPGIPPAIRSRIFDPFFTTKPVGEGTGLGLSLTLKIIKQHHGDIGIDETPGGGCTIRLEFPRILHS